MLNKKDKSQEIRKDTLGLMVLVRRFLLVMAMRFLYYIWLVFIISTHNVNLDLTNYRNMMMVVIMEMVFSTLNSNAALLLCIQIMSSMYDLKKKVNKGIFAQHDISNSFFCGCSCLWSLFLFVLVGGF